MKYVKTKQPQILNSEERISDIVYMKSCNRSEGRAMFNNELIDIVSFDVEKHLMKEMIINMPDETTIIETRLVLDSVKKAFFKASTFYGNTFTSLYPSINPNNYAEILMSQIAFINQLEFTGNELQQTRFWNLGINDMEIVEIG